MKKYAQNILLLIAFLFITSFSFAQGGGVSVSASVNKDRILIGEPILLTLEASLPPGTSSGWFVTDTLPHFEFINKAKIDSSIEGEYKQILTITSFDSGVNMIPMLSLEINGRSYLTDSIPIEVSFSEFDPKKDYHDIKDILEVEPFKEGNLKWFLLGAGILLLLILIWYLRRRSRKKPVAVVAPAPVLSPLQEAMQALEELKSQPLPAKQYYSAMNDIIRRFVLRKTGITTMQKTNEEFIYQLDKHSLPHEDFIALTQTLRLTDAVKFAKYIPEDEEKERSYGVIKKSIEQLNNINNSAV